MAYNWGEIFVAQRGGIASKYYRKEVVVCLGPSNGVLRSRFLKFVLILPVKHLKSLF